MSQFWIPGDSVFGKALREPNLLIPGRKPVSSVRVNDTLGLGKPLHAVVKHGPIIADTYMPALVGRYLLDQSVANSYAGADRYGSFLHLEKQYGNDGGMMASGGCPQDAGTIVAVYRLDEDFNNYRYLFESSTANAFGLMWLSSSSSRFVHKGSNTTIGSASPFTADGLKQLVLTWTNARLVMAINGGIVYNGAINSGATSHGSDLWVLSQEGGEVSFPSNHYFSLVTDRYIGESLARQLSSDPYMSLSQSNTAPIILGTAAGGGLDITPSSIASAEAFGTPTIAPGAVSVQPSGIASAEAHGTPTVIAGALTIQPDGITSAEVVSVPAVTPGAVAILPSGIASLESVPNPALIPGAVALLPSGIASAETFGDAFVSAGAILIAPNGIPSLEAFGSHSVTGGAAVIVPNGIPSAEAFGVLTLQPGAVSIQPSGIDSGEAFGAHTVQPPAVVIVPSGITSGEIFGDSIVIPGATVIQGAGIASAEAFGTLTIIGGAQFLGWLEAQLRTRPALAGSVGIDPSLAGRIRMRPGGLD